VARVAVGQPLNGIVEVAGPERLRFDDFIRRGLSARHGRRQVLADPGARYFGGRSSVSAPSSPAKVPNSPQHGSMTGSRSNQQRGSEHVRALEFPTRTEGDR
jgi:hypothetical protein